MHIVPKEIYYLYFNQQSFVDSSLCALTCMLIAINKHEHDIILPIFHLILHELHCT